MEQYKEGTVFELYENDEQEYIILKNINIDGSKYLVVAPVNGEKENLTMNSKKMLLLKVDDNNETEIVDNETIIRKAIDNLF